MPEEMTPVQPSGTFLVRDKNGQLRVLKGSTLTSYAPSTSSHPQASATPPVPKPVPPASTVPAAVKPVSVPAASPSQPVTPPPPPVSRPAPVPVPPPTRPTPPPPPPPVPASAPAPLAQYEYDPTDTAEIAQHAEKLTTLASGSTTQDYDALVDDLIRTHTLSFTDDILTKRFRTVVTARLKDVRDSIETRDRLTRAEKVGGLGLTDDLAGRIMSDVERMATQVQQGMRVQPTTSPVPKPVAPAPSTPSVHEQLLEKIRAQVPPPPTVPTASVVPPPVVPTPPVPVAPVPVPKPAAVVQPPRPAAVRVQTPNLRTVPTMPPVARPAAAAPSPIRRQFVTSERPTISDVRPPIQVMGPVDELRTLTIDELRRLTPSPADAMKKVEEKIDLLTEESFVLRSQGIAAWKQSPVNQLYLEIGRQSMEAGQPIDAVIGTRLQQGLPTVSVDEFNAIVDLNKRLRF